MENEAPAVPDAAWVGRQVVMTAVGTVAAFGGLATAVIGLVFHPSQPGSAAPYPIVATAGAGVLAISCLINLVCWLVMGAGWRHRTHRSYTSLRKASLGAHVVSYAAVLVGMFGTLAASAIAGWDSASGVWFGICFLLIIFGQILAGSQYLRTAGAPGTVPNHLRRLNRYVKSQR